MTLPSGGRLGPFEIVGPLGAGGMGEVYEARDTRLGRTVAIKILPSGLNDHAERLARFEREARAVSQLSHPNVCTLHDVGEENGVRFLLMEHCQGETLADRIARGPMELRELLRHGAEIADALHAAHRRGIIHRDLKPGNVMLTPGGVKLLDFGLARMAEEGAGDAMSGDLPTVARNSEQALTADGVVLGTYPYMAPEQVEGAETDARADIFALGAVLYEMATGRRAFSGKSAASVMAAVLKEEPAPITSLRPVSPPALDHVVNRCLAKDPEERWQSARDVAAELRWIDEAGSAAGVAAPVAKRRKSRERTAWSTAAILGLLLLVLAAIWAWTWEPAEPPVVTFAIDIPRGSFVSGPAVSPDGQTIAYSLWDKGAGQLYLHSLSELEPEPVLGAANAGQPFFSPDGRWIGYFADGALRRIPRSGGSPVTIATTETLRGAVWQNDGTIIFSKNPPSGLWQVSEAGGTATELTTINLGAKENRVDSHFWPGLLPGGNGVLYSAWSPGGAVAFRTMALDLESGESKPIVEGVAAVADESGRLLYIDDANDVLNAVPFDAATLETRGEPKVIARNVGDRVDTRGGTLAYSTLRQHPQRLVRVDEGGARDVLSLPEKEYEQVVISPDGRRAAVVLDEDDQEIWIVDLERGTSSRLTTYAGYDSYPVWSPDGEWIIFASDRNGPPNLYRVRARGGNVERLTTAMAVQAPAAITAEGKVLMHYRDVGAGGANNDEIGLADPETGEIEPLIFGGSSESRPRLSPDGRWMLYMSDETGDWEAYLSSFPDLREKLRVTLDGAQSLAEWAPDGRRIYYVNEDRMMAVPFSSDNGPRLGDPVPLFDVPDGVSFDVGPDGRFLLSERVAPHEREIVVVVNWSQSN